MIRGDLNISGVTGKVEITGKVGGGSLITGNADITAPGDVTLINSYNDSYAPVVKGTANITSTSGSIDIEGAQLAGGAYIIAGTGAAAGNITATLTAAKRIVALNLSQANTDVTPKMDANVTEENGYMVKTMSAGTPSIPGVYRYGGDVSDELNLYTNTPTYNTAYAAGDGWALWTPTLTTDGTVASGKLTLEDFVCSTNISGGSVLLLPDLPGDIALELFGTNSLTATAASGKALNAPIYGSLSVSGTGSLTLNGRARGLSYNGVADGASLTIGGSASITANSIYSNRQINVDSGTLNCPNVYTETTFGKNGGTVNALVAEGKASYLANAVFSVYGDVTLAADTTIYDKSAGDGLTINTGATLTIPAGKTLTVQDSAETGVPQITNSGAIVNNGAIVLPSTYAEDIPAAIKAMKLTGTGTVTVDTTAYSNAGGKALGALAFTNKTTSSATSLDNDGYTYVKGDGVGTLTLQNAAVIASAENGISFKNESTAPAMTFAIVLVGQNSVSVSSDASECSGIYSNADLTISGGGTLEVGAKSAKYDSTGIYVSGGTLTVADGCTLTAKGGDSSTASYGIAVVSSASPSNPGTGGDMIIGKNALVTAASGAAANGNSFGISTYDGNMKLGENAVLTATGGNSQNGYRSGGISLQTLSGSDKGKITLANHAALIATGADAADDQSFGLEACGLTVGEGASVTAKSGSAEATYGISNYGADITVNGGTVTAAAGDTTGTDSSYSFGIDVANCNMLVSGTGTVDAAAGKAADSVGIELSQGRSYDPDTGVTTYYDNGKLTVSDSAKVTAKSGDPAGTYPGSVGLICPGLSLSDSASLDAQGVNYGIRAAGVWSNDEDGEGIQSTSAISVSDSASLSAAASSSTALSFGLQGVAAVDVSGGTAKFAGSTAAVYLYGDDSNVTVASGLAATTTPAGGTLKSALISGTVTYKSYTADAALTVSETTGVPTNACTAVTIEKAAPSVPGDTTKTTTNPDGSTTTVVTKPDGSTTTTVKQPDGVATVTGADKDGKPTGAAVTVPDTVKGDVPVSLPANLGAADGAVTVIVTYPDGTKKTVVGNYSDGKINLDVSGSAAIEILDDFVPLSSLPLADIPSGAYYHDAVIWAAMNRITGGKTDTTFAPNDTCTRAETVTFLWRAMGSPEPTGTACPFTDVSAEAYYYKAVLWAVEKRITDGTSATTFSPNAPVTRAQAVTFLWRTAGSPAATAANPFTDVGSGLYYTDAVLWAASRKITTGTSATTFSPGALCTRGQFVTFLFVYGNLA